MPYCKECGIQLIGRTDKKFCSDFCRIHYHNTLNRQSNEIIKIINKKLKKNALILDKLISHDITTVKIDLLRSEGFDFVFFTHEHTVPAGEKYKCCYNYGYHHIDHDDILLICLGEAEYPITLLKPL